MVSLVLRLLCFVLTLLVPVNGATFVTTRKHAPQIDNARPACKAKDFPEPFCPPGSTLLNPEAHWSYTENAGDYTRNCVTHTSCSDT